MKKRLTFTELMETGEIPFSDKTLRKKIKESGFPHSLIDGRYYFELDQVKSWFKRREKNKAS